MGFGGSRFLKGFMILREGYIVTTLSKTFNGFW